MARAARLDWQAQPAAQQEDCKIPFNGSGTYNPPSSPGAFNPAISGQEADPASWNDLLTDLSTALSTTITSDGQSTVTGNIPFNGFRLTGVGNATSRTDAVPAGQVQDGGINFAADTGAADAYAIAPAPAVSTYLVGQEWSFKVVNANLTTTPTLAVNGLAAGTITYPDGTALVAGALPVGAVVAVRVSAVTTGTPTFQLQTVATTAATQLPSDNTKKIATDAFVHLFLPRGLISGLTLSTAGGSGTFGIAAGSAADSTNLVVMNLPSAFTKTTAAWTLGTAAGSLDTGAIANNTWYSVYAINRPDTNVTDILISLSATSPTLPANYTLFRRIGSIRTDGSAHWLAFLQSGDTFQWVTLVADISANNPGTAAVTRTLTVPTGVSVVANMQVMLQNVATGGVSFAYLSDLATTDLAASGSTPLADTAASYNGAGGVIIAGSRQSVRTNTSAQIRSRLAFSDGDVTLYLNTVGWVDSRGKDS